MNKKTNAEMSVDERKGEFHETYGNHFDAGWTLVHLVTGCGKFLSEIVGPARANAAMAEAIRDLADVLPENWEEELEEAGTDAFSAWPLGVELHDLTAYALFGLIFKDDGTQEERREFLETKIQAVVEFYEKAPIDLWNIAKGHQSELGTLVTLVRNRWALDNNKPIEPFALAYFGDLTEGSIRNMMSGKNAVFTNQDGKIPANGASAWLATRPLFRNSIWQESAGPNYQTDDKKPVAEPVFVPMARDGSVFHAGLRRGSGYTIGKKGEEQQQDSFSIALLTLQQMPTPYWRRPNEKGNFGIVRGVRWVRLDQNFLDSIADDSKFRLPENFAE